MGSAALRQTVLDDVRKRAEQAVGNKPESSIPPRALPPFLPPVPALHPSVTDCDLKYMSNKVFIPHFYPSNRNTIKASEVHTDRVDAAVWGCCSVCHHTGSARFSSMLT